ncbi:uncharacterized protein LOC100828457 isoform X3 [Brachypodium distachyon]|uniref:uncharacterized protein LOC100828457 isoform X3 n=1 Tax=Brachypodium distachyon TaxID=15368 RepID=UPI00052FDD58|nr:uncharacterized protein LOC100828457 isoform X3 [Brachypodium distachyon]|eukprot:XP_014752712.1 uncharacterized protein LOC100828457 isoform X3 [Brachypodium distachyon]
MDLYSDDDSDPEFDEGLQEDLDLVRRSCIAAGADPAAASAAAQVSSYLTTPSVPSSAAALPAAAGDGLSDDDDEDEEEEDEDLALVRSIRENLHLNKASPSSPLPSEPRPICVWPPSDTDDDDEDDLETLRAIQRRFSHYQAGTSTGPPENMKNETSKVGGDEFIAHQPGEEDVEKQNPKALNRARFPKAALLLVDALKKNRACQKLIRRKMINIEAKIEVNKDLRDRVKCLMDYQLGCRRSFGRFLCQKVDPRVRLISSRKPSLQSEKKMSALLHGPAENLHVSEYKAVLKQFPISLQKQSWSDMEKDSLAKGVKQQYQEILIKNSMKNGSSTGDFSALDIACAMTNTAGNFEVPPEILRSVLPLVNWDKIAAMYLPGRSGAECESRWLNVDDPLINNNAWTAHEEKTLILTVQEKGMHNWINIAVALGTQRTPFQCLARYQRSLNPHILKRVWTKEEDLQLLAAVETFGCNWQLVSASMDGRIGNQCSNRWRKTLLPERTRVGRWSEDEDKRLMVSVKLFGSGSWIKIAQFVPGRTQSQCSERWRNVLDPDIDHGEWRPEEDSKLLASVHQVGACWSKIAGDMIPRRTDNMCLRRWKRLCQDEVPRVIATNQVKKSIFQTNFVDRETERPAIGPSDFPLLVYSKVDRGDGNTVSDQVKKRSRGTCKDNLPASDPSKSSADVASVNTTTRKSRKKSSGSGSEMQTGEDIAVSNGVNKSSSGHSRARKRKSNNGNTVVVQKRMRGSISFDNEASLDILGGPIGIDNEAPRSVGKEGTSEKRTNGFMSAGNEGTLKKKMRGSISVGDERAAKKKARGSVPIGNEGNAVKRKRATRKSAKDSSAADMADACELDLPTLLSEASVERDVDTGNVNKMKRKSTPRPRHINIAEGAADEYSRLADCLSFARRNGTSRNKSCSMRSLNNAMQSNGPSGENLQGPTVTISAGPDPIPVENGSTAKLADND